MNVKLHTPSTLKAGSGFSSAKQFFLSLLATTVSIVLTFGTAAIIDHHKKETAKKEMVMMIISDFDKTIEQAMSADTLLREACSVQQELAVHPEYFDSLNMAFASPMMRIKKDFPETTEKIFSTSIETFNTISNFNFVNEVSTFYIYRRKYQEDVLNKLDADVTGMGIPKTLNALFRIDTPEYIFSNLIFLEILKECRNKCMQMMNVSEKDMKSFNKQHISKDAEEGPDSLLTKMMTELEDASKLIDQAREKYKD